MPCPSMSEEVKTGQMAAVHSVMLLSDLEFMRIKSAMSAHKS